MDFHRWSVLMISLLLSSSTLSLRAQPLEARATPTPDVAAVSAYGRLPLNFVKNQGQFDERAQFVVRHGGVMTYCTREGFVLQLVSRERQACVEDGLNGANVFFTFEGAASKTRVQGREELPGRFHYLRGQDPAHWYTDVPTYHKIHYEGLYPGIDLELREGEPGHLEYDLILMPGADLHSVLVRCEGGTSLALDDQGALVLETAAGDLKQPRPVTYQIAPNGEMSAVECSFRIVDQTHFGFEARSWDPQALLVIDPGLVYSTFLGGTSLDIAKAIAVDSAGAAYVVGEELSSGFPTTPGAFDTSFNGSGDAFVTKLDASGSGLVYSTFLGGTLGENAMAIAVDSAGVAYVAGLTSSPDFPTTPGAFDTSFNPDPDDYWNMDVFVTKLNASGSALVYSTFLGGTHMEFARGIAVDSAGAAYVVGRVYSFDFPTTSGAFDTSFNGTSDSDAFVTKLNASGSALVYSTFLGGTLSDYAWAVTVDSGGAAYLAGYSESSGFPTTSGAFDTSFNGIYDGFVTKLDASGGALVYSTFLGGTSDDFASAIAVDSAGAAYLAGRTNSSGFPTTPGAFDTGHNGTYDGFVTKLDAAGSAVVYSTFLGGTGSDDASAIAVDSAGAVLVTGSTDSSDFPTTPGAFDASFNGGTYDGFVAKVDIDYCQPAEWSNYGTGWPGTLGIPGFTSSANPSLGSTITLNIDNSLGANTTGFLAIGLTQASLTTVFGGTLLLLPMSIATIPVPAAGLSLPGTIPPGDASWCGLAVFLQVLEIDAGASKGVSFTPGLELDLGT